jgi:hypothetical protein
MSNKYFCPIKNGNCVGECCKFFCRSGNSDCSIVSWLNMIYDIAPSLDGIYQEVKELVDTVKNN